MKKKHIITITGSLGSGKSSTSKKLAELLKYKHASTGDFMRSMAEKRGLTLNDLNKIGESDPSIDIEIDDYSREIGKEENVVMDSRLGFHFIPKSFKVFLKLDPNIAANRILEDAKVNPNRHKESRQGFSTIEDIVSSINTRLKSETKRYKELYKINNYMMPENFDLVIDTSEITLEQVSEQIITKYKVWLDN